MSTHTERFFSRKSSGRYGQGIRLNQVNFMDASFGGIAGAPGVYNIKAHARPDDRHPAGPPARPRRAVRPLPLPGAPPGGPRRAALDPRPAHPDRDAPPRVLAGILQARSPAAGLGPPPEALADGGRRAALRSARHPSDPGGDRGLRGAQVLDGVAPVRARSARRRGPRGP